MPTTNPAVTQHTPAMALHPQISATGVKGFLIWMKTDPVMGRVYKQVQPQLNQLLAVHPPGLSGRTRRRRLAGLGCCGGFSCCGGGGFSCCGGSACSYCDMASSDSTIAAAPSDAVGSSGITSSLSNIISTGASLALTADQIANQNAITTAQLNRAAAGARPLNTVRVPVSSSFMSGKLFGLPTWLVLGGGLVAVILASKK